MASLAFTLLIRELQTYVREDFTITDKAQDSLKWIISKLEWINSKLEWNHSNNGNDNDDIDSDNDDYSDHDDGDNYDDDDGGDNHDDYGSGDDNNDANDYDDNDDDDDDDDNADDNDDNGEDNIKVLVVLPTQEKALVGAFSVIVKSLQTFVWSSITVSYYYYLSGPVTVIVLKLHNGPVTCVRNDENWCLWPCRIGEEELPVIHIQFTLKSGIPHVKNHSFDTGTTILHFDYDAVKSGLVHIVWTVVDDFPECRVAQSLHNNTDCWLRPRNHLLPPGTFCLL